jgi:hypothetical protein
MIPARPSQPETAAANDIGWLARHQGVSFEMNRTADP